MPAVFGRKVGMTEIIQAGRLRPVTVVAVVPTKVERTGNLGGGKDQSLVAARLKKIKNIPKPQKGYSHRRGFSLRVGGQAVGEAFGAVDFRVGQKVSIRGVTKGKGFSGTIKRHGFRRGPESHGGDNVRRPGAIGSQAPQRVIKGKKMAGRMGGERRTIHKVEVLDVLPEEGLLLLAGSIPGPNKGVIEIWNE